MWGQVKKQINQREKKCVVCHYLSCLPLEVHIFSGGRLPLIAMKVGWEELQREVGAGRHKSLLEGNQYKQDKKARPEHKLCSPSFLFSHQRGECLEPMPGLKTSGKDGEEGVAGQTQRENPSHHFFLFEVLSYTHLILFYQCLALAN